MPHDWLCVLCFSYAQTYVRKDAEEAIPGLEISNKKKAAKEEAPKEKPKKTVRVNSITR